MAGTRCYWATAAPAGLCDAAEDWGITLLAEMFAREHKVYRNHDPLGTGRCRVCGSAMDFEKWLDEQAEQEAATHAEP